MSAEIVVHLTPKEARSLLNFDKLIREILPTYAGILAILQSSERQMALLKLESAIERQARVAS